MQLQSLVYSSTASMNIGLQHLWPLLKKARERNQQRNISGMLLYSDGRFMQCLEGRPSDISHVYRYIQKDERHRNLIELARESISERRFSQWTMGFGAIQTTAFSNPWAADEIAPEQMLAVLNGDGISQRLLRSFWNDSLRRAA